MTALLVIGGAIAYLVMGGIAAAFCCRMGDGTYDDDPFRGTVVAFWPLLAIVAAIGGLAWAITSGAYRGGMWLVDSVANRFESRSKSLHERAVKLAVAEALKRRRQ